MFEEIDYDKVDAIIQEMRSKSYDYLENAFDSI